MRTATSRLHELHEQKLPLVLRVEFANYETVTFRDKASTFNLFFLTEQTCQKKKINCVSAARCTMASISHNGRESKGKRNVP